MKKRLIGFVFSRDLLTIIKIWTITSLILHISFSVALSLAFSLILSPILVISEISFNIIQSLKGRIPNERLWGKKQGFLFSAKKREKKETNRVTHAALSMSCRAGCDSLGSRSERLRNARANQLPKQQLPADGSVFLIRLLQLWMVHSNQAARHPLANAAYHTLAGEEEEEREEEERRGKRGGKRDEDKK